jgi:hypothetical protein
VDLLVHDRRNDSEDSNGEDANEDHFALPGNMGDVNHDAGNDNQAEVRRYVKNHLDYGVVMICRALWVRNGKCPVLGEWSADDAEVDNFNDEERDYDIAKQNPEGELESRKHAAIEVSRPRSL